MPSTLKFSQFSPGGTLTTGDIVVGLRNGVNTQFTWGSPSGIIPLAQGGTSTDLTAPGYEALFSWNNTSGMAQFLGIGSGLSIVGGNLTSSGGGGGGSVGITVTQSNTFTSQQWVRFNPSLTPNPGYDYANATTPQFAEAIGIVTNVTPTSFTLTQSGYVTGLTGLMANGYPYYLDTINGGMTQTPTNVTGQVNLPVFIADTPTSGWILDLKRGYIIGNSGLPINQSPGLILRLINQPGHTFTNPNTWVYLSAASIYTRAIANTLASSEVIGVVTQVLDANNFMLQQIGYCGPGVFSGLAPATAYYLSDTSAGMLEPTPPSALTSYVRPCLVTETNSTGWIFSTWPTANSGNIAPNQRVITQPGNGFELGNIVRVLDATKYTLAQANQVVNTWSVGMVVGLSPINPDIFVLQTDGYTNALGTVTDAMGEPIAPNQTYWLSDILGGEFTPIAPTNTASYTKPVLTGLSSSEGYILSHRADPVSNTPTPPEPDDLTSHTCLMPTTQSVSSSWVNVPCLTATITPGAATSLILINLVMAVDRAGPTANAVYLRITRNGIPIGSGSATGSQISANTYFSHNTANQQNLFMDNPMTTSAVTYGLQVMSPAGATVYYQNDYINTYAGCSTIVLQEIT